MNLYTIRDNKAKNVMPPFAAPNDGVACRYIMDSLRDAQSSMARYPEDFQLLHLGEYAEDDGAISPAKEVRVVGEVSTLKDAMKA